MATEMSPMTLVRHVTVTEDHWEVRPETMAQVEETIGMLRQFCGIAVSDRREEKDRERLAAERDREAFQKKLEAMTPEERKVAELQHEQEQRYDAATATVAEAKNTILMSLLPLFNEFMPNFRKKDPLKEVCDALNKLTVQSERNAKDLDVIKAWFREAMSASPVPDPVPIITPPPSEAKSSETKPSEANSAAHPVTP